VNLENLDGFLNFVNTIELGNYLQFLNITSFCVSKTKEIHVFEKKKLQAIMAFTIFGVELKC
jgi:hypothetical protein